MILWVLGGLVGLAVIAALALMVAIRMNGPAVLDGVDRLTGPGAEVERIGPIDFGDHEALKLFVHRAASRDNGERLPVLIFIHGGGWSNGDPADYSFVGRSFAPEGLVVVKPGYRLAETGKYPAMLEDAAAAFGWVRANISEYGGDPERIYLAGHSAGAYNAVMLALDTRWLENAGHEAQSIRGVVGLAGPYDFLPLTGDGAKRAFGDEADLDVTQPINYVRSEAPPMLLMTGLDDDVVSPRNTSALSAELERSGVTVETKLYEGVNHSRILMNLASPWRTTSDVRQKILDFIAAQEQASVPVQGKTG